MHDCYIEKGLYPDHRDIKRRKDIRKMEASMIKPCPICGSEKIDIKREIITRFEIGDDKLKVWAFCRNCGHRGLGAFGRFSKTEAQNAAIKMWNKMA